MRKFYPFIVVAFLAFATTGYATVIGPGGAAITSWNADLGDDFSFVLLQNISGTTEIYFTDQGWDSTNTTWNTGNEGEILWSYTGILYAGTEISIKDPSSASPTVNIGTVTKSGSFNVTSTEDQIIAYSGTGVPNDGSEVINFIWAVYSGNSSWGFANTTSETDLPNGLIDGVTAVDFDTDDNYQYNCDSSYDPDSLNLSIANSSNYSSGSSNEDYGGPDCAFLITQRLDPIIAGGGYALEFDGTDDYILASTNGNIQLGDRFSVETWVLVDDLSNFPWMFDLNGQYWGHIETDGDIRQRIITDDGNQFYENINFGFETDQWIHFAMSYDGSNVRYYKNGVLTDTKATTGTVVAGDSLLTIGALITGAQYRLDGQLDEFRVWEYSLSANDIRNWMCKRIDSTHSKLDSLAAYYRFDHGTGATLYDYTRGNHGELNNIDEENAWVTSGAAIGDRSFNTYSGSSVNASLVNQNAITVDDFSGADGIHLYTVSDTAFGSSYPGTVDDAQDDEYFGVFMVGGSSYDVTIDYSNNSVINGQANESQIRGIKRSGGDDTTWEVATGVFNTNTVNNTISILDQTGTEYVTGFATLDYPDLPGSGYAIELDGTNDFIGFGKVNLFSGLTYSAWINTTSDDSVSGYAGNPALTIIGDHTNNVWNGFGVHGGRLRYTHYTGSWDSIVGATIINDGKWHHVAVSHNQASGLVHLFVDGKLDAFGNIAYGAAGGALKVGFDRIGGGYLDAAGTQDFFDGKIDEVTAWSTDLDSNQIRKWMTKKLNGSHDSIASLVAYFKCDEGSGVVLEDIAGGQNGAMTNGPGWAVSGAALGDESTYTYGTVSTLSDTLSNGNIVSIGGFNGAAGIHLYTVTDTAEFSSYSSFIASADSTKYFGVFMVDGKSYDVIIDYSANSSITGSAIESQVRGIKRSGGDDATWSIASGELRTNTTANTISILNQTGTEYVTGFANASYPVRPGSGYALDFDGQNEHVILPINLNPATSEYTIECWLRVDSIPTTNGYGVVRQNGPGSRSHITVDTDGKIGNFLGGVSLKSANVILPNKWYHVAVSYDGSVRKIYINGSLEASSSVVAQSADSSWSISSPQSAFTPHGQIDEIRFWNTELDSNLLREWMCKKLNATHDSLASLLAYYRFDDIGDTTLADLAGGNDGILTNMDASTDWVYSGAALGDQSKFTYGGTSLIDTIANGNEVTLSDFADADGIHLYTVNDTAVGSSYPNTLASADSTEYFGVFKVGGTSYDVTIDYTNNTAINGQTNEQRVRGIKRSGGDDVTWQTASGELRTNTTANTISILNQTGTEYVTGFTNTTYPVVSGSGYAIDLDGGNDHIEVSNSALSGFSTSDSVTIEFWVKTAATSAATPNFISVPGDYAAQRLAIYLSNGQPRINLVDSGGSSLRISSSKIINDDKWHHLTFQYDGSENANGMSILVDGMDNGTVIQSNNFATFTGFTFNDTLQIGTNINGSGNFIDATIDEVRIWNAAFSQEKMREWMTKKLTPAHDSINYLLSYYRFDENTGSTVSDLASGATGSLTNGPVWVASGAALGDESMFTYGGTSLVDTLTNGNEITIDDFTGADGIHLYTVTDTAEGSSYPSSIGNSADSAEYFGVFMVGDSGSYDVTIDYSANSSITGSAIESQVRGIKRSGGDDDTWEMATGELRTNTDSNTIQILNQTGTEYVTGFANAAYPARPGSGYALDFDGTDDYVLVDTISNQPVGSEARTIEAWFKSTKTNGLSSIVNFGNEVHSERFAVRTRDLDELGIVCAGSNRYYSVSLGDSNWHHVAVSMSAGDQLNDIEVYFDGILLASVSSSSGSQTAVPNTPLDATYIGQSEDDTRNFQGSLDEIRIWNTALDSNIIREWMTKKVTASHDSIDNLVAYYRFDDATGTTLADLAGSNDGTLTNMDSNTDWIRSGAAIGDESVYTYGGSSLSDTLSNGNEITLDDFDGADGMHLYLVNDTAVGSSYPGSIGNSADSAEYFGVFMVGNSASYDVTIDYSANTAINGQANEQQVRAIKRENGADDSWKLATGELRTNTTANIISILNQTGTEYVTGFVNTAYPSRAGSGYALSFDGVNDYIIIDTIDNAPSGAEARTYEVWYRSEDSTSQTALLNFGEGLSNGNRFSVRVRNGNRVGIGVSGSNRFYEANTVSDGKWHHIAISMDSGAQLSQIRVYLDGVLRTDLDASTGSQTIVPNTLNREIYFGSNETQGTLAEAEIDEVRIWNSALDSATIRKWMCRKIDTSHQSMDNLVAYYRFDESSGTELIDLAGGNTGVLTNSPTWQRSGAALGDTSLVTYGTLSSLSTTLSNGNLIILDDFDGADGIHLYRVEDTAAGSSYPSSMGNTADSSEYFGVFKVGGSSYDVTIDYSANAGINGSANESLVRGIKRTGGDDTDWEVATGELRTNTDSNTISIFNQTGTEYVTGFSNSVYPVRPGSGYALEFDGANDYVELGNDPDLTFTDKMTIEFWAKTDASVGNYNTMVSKWYSGGDVNGGSYSFYYTNSGLQFALQDTGNANLSVSTTQYYNDGEWHHFAGSWDGDSARLFVDGIKIGTSGSASFGNYLDQDTRNTRIGTDDRYSPGSGDRHFEGSIDEVRFWRAELDQETIREWMTKKLTSSHSQFSDLEAYYRFDESSGDTLYDLVGANDGSIANMTATDWVYSGAALGDESKYTYSGVTVLVDTLTNNNEISLDNFAGADGIHLYRVIDTAVGSSYPSEIGNTADSVEYFGVFMVGGANYDVTIDYSANAAITGSSIESQVRGIKRHGGDDATWNLATGEFRTNVSSNTISILNQSGTEYVTGFTNTTYPSRPGSGHALDFDGSDDQIDVSGTGLSAFSTTDSITVETWVKINSSASGFDFIYNSEDAGSSGIRVLLSDGRPRFGVFGANKVGSVIQATDTINDGQWHHLAYVYDGSQALSGMSIYLDGVELATTQILTNAISSGSFSDTAFVGRYYSTAEQLDGQIDELRVWNRALDSTEIRTGLALKLNSNYANISDLVSYYRFDENTGTGLTDLVGGSVGVLTNMDASTDWVLSGASLGDTSVFDYDGSSVLITASQGDVLEVSPLTGNSAGIHLYRVDEAPNDTVVPIGSISMDTTHYYGLFIAGGTNPTANIAMDYSGNANYLSQNNGDDLSLIGRYTNADDSWSTKASSIFTNQTAVDSLRIFSQESGTEIIVGQSDYLTPPGSGYALDFDGSDDHVAIEFPLASVSTADPSSISVWIKTNASGQNYIFSSDNGSGLGRIRCRIINGLPNFSIRDNSNNGLAINGTDTINNGKWHHLTFTYDGSKTISGLKIYVDGIEQTTTVQNNTTLATQQYNTTGTIGVSNSNAYFDGQIDELSVWNTVLDSTVIRKWMSRKMDITHDSISHLVSYYRFDQQGDTNLIDLIGGNHGSLENMDENTDWVTSGAAIGDMSVYTYDSSALGIELPNNDSVFLTNFDAGVQGVQLYYVAERSNFTDFYGAQSVDTSFYFGVHKAGADTATYDVTMRYGNSSHLTGASAQYRVGLASRDNNADASWESKWFEGNTNTGTETIFLPNQTGTEYAGIVSANNALDFDGVDDFVELTTNLDPSTTDVTISCWFKPDNVSSSQVLVQQLSGGGQGRSALLVHTSGVLRNSWGDVQIDGTTTLNVGQWYHAAVVLAGATRSLYLNGVLENSGSVTMEAADGNWRLARGITLQYLDGQMDEVRILSRALCQDEIQAQMNCQLDSVNNDSLVAYYSFNQGVADSTNTSLDSLIDLSGNGNNGTLTNMALTGTSSNWTGGSTGITGSCEPYIGAEIYVLSEGDTIVNYDSIASTADSTNFGDVVFQATTTVQYEVHNTGGDTLDIDTIYFTGSDSAFFSASYPNHIAPGVSSIITMQVTPTASDSIFAYLNLATNDCDNSPYRFQVKGNVLGYAGALNFDGVNDYVNILDTLGYVGLKEFTVEAWIRIDTSTGSLQAIMSATGTELFHFQTSSSGSDNNVFYTNNGIVSLPIFPETPYDEWRHVAMVAKSGGSNVYINGSLYGTGNSAVFDSILVTNNIRIGSGFGASRFFDGDIDEIRLWNRALDSTEIQANLNCELEGTECGLIAYYNFNSDTARTFATNTGLDTLIDSSGNGHYGVLMNMALAGDSSNWSAQSDSILNNCIDNGDLVGPIVIPVDTLTVFLDSNGIAIIDPNLADSASCDYYSGIESFAVDQDTVTCTDNGDTIVLTAQDSAGLTGSASFIVKVVDTIPPQVITQNVTVYLDASGQATVNVAAVNNGTSDHCGIDSLWLSDTVFSCADTAGDTIWLIAQDVNNNIDSSIAIVTAADTIRPIVQAQTVSIYLDSSGTASLDTSDLLLSATDNCDIDSMWLSQSIFSCADTNGVLDTLFVQDSQGNISFDTATVFIYDTIAPYLNLTATTMYFDTNGQLSIEYGDLVSTETEYFIQQSDLSNWNAYSGCSGYTRLISSAGLETWSWTDNLASGTQIDSAKIELNWGFSGTGATRTYSLNGNALGSSPGPNFGACAWGQVSFDLDTSHYNVGSSNSFTWDIIASTYVIFPNPDWSGAYGKVTVYSSVAFDNCSDSSQIAYVLSDTNFDCADTGANTITVTGTDLSGNSISGNVVLTILDTVLPNVQTQNLTVYLDTSGSVTILADSVNNTSTDNCSIDSTWLSDSVFTCADTLGDTIWLYAQDVNGNIDSAFAVITVHDTVDPIVIAQSIQVYLDSSGSATIAADSIDFGTNDNCAVDSLWLDQYTFGCSDSTGTIVTLFARDVSGNISSDTTVIYTIDTIPPVIFVTNDTIYLNTAGVATLDTGMVNNGTTDNCQVDSLWLSQTSFNCDDTASSNPVTFYAKDVSGNIDSFGITIIVVDTVVPTMITQNITVYLDATGSVSIDTSDINNGSTDNCVLDTMWLSAYNFTCVDSLDTVVTLFGRDKSGNISSANATVTILDTIRPQALVSNLTIYLDSNGSATIGADSVDNGTTDNCSVDSIWLSKSTFGCGDTIAPDTITFFVRDVSGNRDSAMAAITVLETQPPVVVPRNLTVYLDVNGGVSFNANDIDSNSSDNCLIDSIWISTDTFACADSNGNNVTLYAKDVSGNVDSAVSVITVLDTVLPTVVTQNRTVYLDGSGNLSIGPDTLDNGSFDNCAIDSTWLSASAFTCADSGDTVIFLIARDISGNVDSSSAILTIEDTLPPTIWTNNVTVYLDSSGFANILPDTVDSASSDNCAIALTWISDSSFSCSDTSGSNTIWFFAKDVSGNVDSSTAIVAVLDTMPPLLLTNDLVVQLNNQGAISVANDSADAGTVDNCQLDSVWMSQTSFSCGDVGINNVIFYGVDITGNVDSTTITVTVQDTVAPVPFAQNLNLSLDSFGSRIITALDIDSGSWDSCGIASYAIDVTSFDCSDVGSSTTVTLTITDVNGNSSTDQSTVTIQDYIAPEVITQNITVYLNDSGYITIVPSQIDNGTWDSCGVDSLHLSVDSFSCGDVGNNNVTLTAIDVNGNSNSASAIVTVLDSTFPAAIAYTDTIIIYLDSFGEATIAADTIDSGSYDNCAFTKAIDVSFYTCVDAGSSHPVVLTITDASGNVSIDTGYVYVDDTIPPVPNTFDSITVFLDSFGFASIDTSDVLIAISDSCAISAVAIDSSNFSCANTSMPIVVTTTITDTNGNVGSDTTVVTVVDNIHPITYLYDTIIYLNDTSSGNATVVIDSASLDSASYDVCGIQSIFHQTVFTCSDIGVNSIPVTVTDVNGNVTTGIATVEVRDTVAPKILLYTNTTIWLNVNGFRNVGVNVLDSASFDNCLIDSRSRAPTSVNCSRVGDTTKFVVTITDSVGNVSIDTVDVYTIDTVLPAPQLHNITVYLDTTGNLTIQGDTVDSASSDACGIDSIWLDKNTFNCGDVGNNTVQVFIRDVNMNIDSTQTTTVTVVDSLAPITYSIDSLIVYLSDSGLVTISSPDIDSGSWDSCGIGNRFLSDSIFTCADVGVFPIVTLSVTDIYGNVGTSLTVIEVLDTVRPVAIPKDTNYFYLDANGQLTITGIDLDSASYDSCGVGTFLTDTANFDCGNIGTPISAQMTVIDVNGNRDSANTVIIILDTVSPIAIAQNISVYLDTNGLVSITPQMVNNGSNDSCGIDTIYIDTANFSCANTAAPVNVTLTVEDVNGNVSTDIAIVTVIDSVNPIVTAHDTVVYLDANGVFVLDTSDINDGSTDNCFIDTMTLSQDTFTCAEAGQTLAITLSAIDGSGNTQSAVANVTVLDTVRPEPITNDIDLYLDANGNAIITASMIDSASYDSCGVDSIWLDIYSFDCGDVGANTVEFFIRDINLNLDSTLATVTVIDTVSPTALALPTFTVWLDNNGDASITRDSVNIGSYDSCGITDYFLNDSIFDCSDVGVFPTVTMTVLDVNGNSSTAQTVVTVLDTVSPSAQATNYTAYLNSGGAITIDSSHINNGSSDNCSIVTITLDTFQFDCSDVGQVNPVVMTVTDASGNMDTAHAFVTVLDTVAPVAIGQNITVYLDSTGNISIDSSLVNNGSYDSCGIDSITLSDYTFDCGDVSAAQDIEMYVFDVNGNSDTVIVTITVEDTVAPQVFTLDSLTIALDSFGNYTLEANEIDSGSWDSCGIDTLILDQSIFGCNDIGSPILVTMTATDVNSNSTTGQTVVTVIDTIAPQVFSMSDTVYLDSSGLISITTLNVDSGSWDSCGIASYAIDTSNFNCANTDTAVKVVLTVTDIHGNVSSDSSFVVIIDSIRPQIICQSDTVIANDSGQCGAVVSYSLPSVSDNCTIDTVFQSGDTTYQSGDEFPVGVTAVQFTVIDVNGNQDSCVFNVTVLDTQSPLILCQSDTLICDSNFIFDLPVVVENCPGDSIEQIAGLSSGSFYPVGTTTNTFVSTDASGNTDTCSFEVTRIDYPSIAVAGQDTALCEAENINLYAVDPVIGIGSWTSIGTGIIADTLDANSAVSQLSIGENEFVWTVRNDVCIPNSDTVLVSIDEQPTQIDLPADTSLCEEPEFNLVDESVAIGQAYWTWDGDATIIDSTSDTVLVSNLGIGTIQLFRTNENGVCIASIDTMLIHNNIVPTVDAGEDFGRFGGKRVTLSPIVIDGSTYSWTPADLFTDPNILEAEVVASQTTTLILTVTSDSGCVASDSFVYSVNGIDSIPTGITPNGDGVNDVWNIAGLSTYNDAEIYIFDQSGREVYFSKGYDTPWDGRLNGQLLPRASYYWIIDLKDGINEPLKGIISIIR